MRLPRSWAVLSCVVAFAIAAALCFLLFLLFPPGSGRPEIPVDGDRTSDAPALDGGGVGDAVLSPEEVEPAGGDEMPGEPVLEDGPWTVEGRVVRGEEFPVAGVGVSLIPHPKAEAKIPRRSASTGGDGRFSFSGLPEGAEVRVVVDDPGSALRIIDADLDGGDADAGDTDRFRQDLGDIALLEPALLVVRLLGPDGGPRADGKISANPPDLPDARQPLTARGDGEYVLERAPPASYEVNASAPGCPPAEVNVELPRDEPLVIQLEEGKRIAGIVRTVDGPPISGAAVEIDAGDEGPEPIRTDPEGRFLFDGLPSGREYEVSVKAPGHVPDEKEIPAGEEGFEFWLIPEAVIAGKAVDAETGEPVAGAGAYASTENGDGGASAEADGAGRFEVRGILPGRIELTVGHDEYVSGEAGPWDLAPGERVDGVIVTIRKGAVLRGKVLDAGTRKPVGGAEVTLYGPIADSGAEVDANRNNNTAGEDGTFAARGLQDGVYRLSASGSGHASGAPVEATAARGAESEIEILLFPSATFAGRVLDHAGKTMPRTRVQLFFEGEGESREGRASQTDGEGRYKLQVSPGTGYAIFALPSGRPGGSIRDLKIGAGETIEGLDIRLSAGGTIAGRVVDAEGRGIPAASVWFNPNRADGDDDASPFYYQGGRHIETGADGDFEARDLAGSYHVGASSPGHLPANGKAVEVAAGERVEVVLVLRLGAAISGRVLDPEGKPVAEASVGIPGNRSTSTDADGRFEIDGLKPGTAEIEVEANGYASSRAEIAIPSTDLAIRLERPASLAGRIRAEGRQVYLGGSVAAIDAGAEEDDGYEDSAQVDATGRFRLTLKAGSYRIVARLQGFAPTAAEVVLGAGERKAGMEIDLRPGGRMEGVVVERGSGRPIEGADVVVDISRLSGHPDGDNLSAETDADGRFVLEGIPEGEVDLAVEDVRHIAASAAGIRVRVGETARARIEMGSGGGLRGSVSRGGLPIAGVEVAASSRDGRFSREDTTGGDGRFEIAGLPQGEYRVTATPRATGFRRGPRIEAWRPVTVEEGRTAEVDLAAEPVLLSGLVTSGGAAGRGFLVRAVHRESGSSAGPARSDPSGHYSLEIPGEGAYVISVERPGSPTVRIPLDVPPGAAEVRRDLPIPESGVGGRVVDADTGEPVEGASVRAIPEGGGSREGLSRLGEALGSTVTDGEGRFSLPLPPGRYRLRIIPAEQAVTEVEGIEVGRERPPELRIAVPMGHDLRLEVLDRSGRRIPDARAIVLDARGTALFFFSSGGNDRLELIDLPAGACSISVGGSDHAPAHLRISIPPRDPPRAVLGAGGRLEVEVVAGSGSPVPGAEIAAIDGAGADAAAEWMYFAGFSDPAGDDVAPAPPRTGMAGAFTIGHAAPGLYRISARIGDKRSAEENVRIDEGGAAAVRLVIE